MNIYKKYILFQNLRNVAQKLCLPCSFKVQNWNGRGKLDFSATHLKFWKNVYFLKIFKWYYYHFLIFLLGSDLEKTLLSQTSIAWGVLGLALVATPYLGRIVRKDKQNKVLDNFTLGGRFCFEVNSFFRLSKDK